MIILPRYMGSLISHDIRIPIKQAVEWKVIEFFLHCSHFLIYLPIVGGCFMLVVHPYMNKACSQVWKAFHVGIRCSEVSLVVANMDSRNKHLIDDTYMSLRIQVCPKVPKILP